MNYGLTRMILGSPGSVPLSHTEYQTIESTFRRMSAPDPEEEALSTVGLATGPMLLPLGRAASLYTREVSVTVNGRIISLSSCERM